MTAEPSGLRERKKQRTRQEISHVATRLFLERGFEAVTIADVAAAAGVAKMTVTNHFARKEDLVLDLHEELVDGPVRLVAERPVGASPFSALRDWHRAAVDRRDAAAGFAGAEFAAMITGSPTLAARLREIIEQRETALTEALAAETGAKPGDLTPRLVAAALTGTYQVLLREVFRRVLAGEPAARIVRAMRPAVETAYELIAPRLADYAVRR